jgi:4'-phosphopantetheinyl transferase
VDVCWLVQNASDVPPDDAWLSPGERGCLAGLRIPKRRADWRLGRWTAKCAVSVRLRLPNDPESLAGIELQPAPSGAPLVFLNGRPAPLALSLSHSSGKALCAISSAAAAVGCDLETVETRSPAFLADYFTDDEWMLMARVRLAARDRLATLLWSAKESALKALGCGLRLDTRCLNAAPSGFLDVPDTEWRLLSVEYLDGPAFHGWWRESDGFVWTVVADPQPHRIYELRLRAEFASR